METYWVPGDKLVRDDELEERHKRDGRFVRVRVVQPSEVIYERVYAAGLLIVAGLCALRLRRR